MKDILLSIIVPVYNVEEYIKPCLNSILKSISRAPNYSYEIIVIDDCGEDSSIAEVEKIKAKHPDLIRIEKHSKNKGLGGARNTGIDIAKGKYLQFIDSDDWIDQTTYLELLPTLQSHPDKILVFGIEANKNGQKVWHYTPMKKGAISTDKAIKMISRDELNASACNKIFPKNAFLNFRFTEKMIYEDLDLIPLVFENNSNGVILFQKHYYYYRQDGESLTRSATSDKHVKDGLKASLRLHKSFKNDSAKGNIILNRWAYFIGKWNLSQSQIVDLVDTLTNQLSQIHLHKYDADQAQLFLKKLNNLEQKVGLNAIIQLKKAFLEACFSQQNNNVLISIIAPVYNNEDYLHRFIDSIDQKYKDFYEIILVDDLSDDSSFELMQSAAKNSNNIKALRIPEKGGAGGARNFGLEHSKGQFILFLDSDDWISSDFFNEVVDCLMINRDLDMIIYGFDVVDNEENISWSSTKILNLPYFNYSGKQVFQLFLDEIINPSPWNKIIKKELLSSENTRFPKNIYHQDLALIPYLMRKSEKISLIKKPLYKYFINNVGISQTASQKHIDSIFLAVDHLFELIQNSSFDYNRDNLIKMALLNYNYNLQLRKNQYSTEQIQNFKKQLLQALKKYQVKLEHILYSHHGRELFTNLKFEFDIRGLNFSLSESVIQVNIIEFIEQFNLIKNQMDLYMESGDFSPNQKSPIEANELRNLLTKLNNRKESLEWYSRTYDHLPKWFLKIGSIFRRIKVKKGF